MSKLTKEEVLRALETGLSRQQGVAVKIEQKGSWYKINDGKSLRFSELENMLAELGDAKTAPVPQTAIKPSPEEKATTTKSAPRPSTNKTKVTMTANTKGGKTPKQLWREKLSAKDTLPQGF